MSYYSDAEDSLKSLDDISESGLRKRKIWDPDTESIASEIKELLEEDVNSLVSITSQQLNFHGSNLNKIYVLGRRGLYWMSSTIDA